MPGNQVIAGAGKKREPVKLTAVAPAPSIFMFISVIIPAYNEESRLPQTLVRVCEYFQRRSAQGEIIIVNDGSRDRTAEAAREFARSAASPRVAVKVLENPGNRGKGYSVRHGMLAASGDWALFSDADLSAPIEECDKLLAAAETAGADIAIGSRAVNRSLIGVHQSLFRENAGRLFNALMRLATGLPFRDTQCGFKLFSQRAARSIFARQRLERFGFDVEVLYLARKLGFRAVEVPVRWSHSEGTKVSMLGDSVDMFFDLWRVRRNDWAGLYDLTSPPAGDSERGMGDVGGQEPLDAPAETAPFASPAGQAPLPRRREP